MVFSLKLAITTALNGSVTAFQLLQKLPANQPITGARTSDSSSSASSSSHVSGVPDLSSAQSARLMVVWDTQTLAPTCASVSRGGGLQQQAPLHSRSPIFSTPVMYEDRRAGESGAVVIVGQVDGHVCALQLLDGCEVGAFGFFPLQQPVGSVAVAV